MNTTETQSGSSLDPLVGLAELEKRANAICEQMADDAKKAKVPDALFQRAMFEEAIEMAKRMRERLLKANEKLTDRREENQ